VLNNGDLWEAATRISTSQVGGVVIDHRYLGRPGPSVTWRTPLAVGPDLPNLGGRDGAAACRAAGGAVRRLRPQRLRSHMA
jgi:hypothetical protein